MKSMPKSIIRILNVLFILFFLSGTAIAEGVSDKPEVNSKPDRKLGKVLARLENDNVKISFVKSKNEGKKSISPVYEIKTASGRYRVPLNVIE